jgi:hypothetical protein
VKILGVLAVVMICLAANGAVEIVNGWFFKWARERAERQHRNPV